MSAQMNDVGSAQSFVAPRPRPFTLHTLAFFFGFAFVHFIWPDAVDRSRMCMPRLEPLPILLTHRKRPTFRL